MRPRGQPVWARQARQAWQARQGTASKILGCTGLLVWPFGARWDGRDGSDKVPSEGTDESVAQSSNGTGTMRNLRRFGLSLESFDRMTRLELRLVQH